MTDSFDSRLNHQTNSREAIFLADEEATEAFGRALALATQNTVAGQGLPTTRGGRIYLSGDLGAGKTTLARGFMRAYGFRGAVKSPTYTLVEPYERPGCSVYHFDLYRIFDPEELEFLGVWDYFGASNLCLVEWPEKGRGLLPLPDLEIELIPEGKGRRACWRALTPAGAEIVAIMKTLLASSGLVNGNQNEA